MISDFQKSQYSWKSYLDINQGYFTQGKLLNVEFPRIKSLRVSLLRPKLSRIGIPMMILCRDYQGITQDYFNQVKLPNMELLLVPSVKLPCVKLFKLRLLRTLFSKTRNSHGKVLQKKPIQ